MVRKVAKSLAIIGMIFLMLNSWTIFLSCHFGWPTVTIGYTSFIIMFLLSAIADWNNEIIARVCYAVVFSVPICVTLVAQITNNPKRRFLLPGIFIMVGDALFVLLLILNLNQRFLSAEDYTITNAYLRETFFVECIVLLSSIVALPKKHHRCTQAFDRN